MDMELLLYIQDCMISVIVLLVLFSNTGKQQWGKKATFDQTLFRYLLVSNVAVLLFDCAMWAMEKRQFPGAYELYWTVTFFYYILNTWMCFLWLLYCDFKLNEDKARIRKRLPVYGIPMAISVIMALCSLKTGWFFSIDSTNTYHRGDLFFVPLLLACVYMVAAFIMAFRHRKDIGGGVNQSYYGALMMFPALPILGCALQTVFFGISVIWSLSVISLLIIFINVQNGQIFTDTLTGLFNRRHFERALTQQMRELPEHEQMALILMDIDKFKQINDTFGHHIGDDALVKFSNILRACCSNENDVAARLGGDEFVLIERMDANGEVIIPQRLEAALREFDRKHKTSYTLAVSIGWAIYEGGNDITPEQLMREADHKMYEIKLAKKRAKQIQ